MCDALERKLFRFQSESIVLFIDWASGYLIGYGDAEDLVHEFGFFELTVGAGSVFAWIGWIVLATGRGGRES